MLEHEIVEEAAEFGRRFPDVSDQDVLDHIQYCYGRKLHDYTILGRAVLMAHRMQDENHALEFLQRMDVIGVK